MNSGIRKRLLAAVLAACATLPNVPAAGGASRRPAGGGEAEVFHLLEANCFHCHNEEKKKGGLVLTVEAGLRKGGDSGEVVKPGRPAESLLLRVLNADGDPHMPPKKQLSAAEVSVVRAWIQRGARWDPMAAEGIDATSKPIRFEALPPGFGPAYAVAMDPSGERYAAARGAVVGVYSATQTNAVPVWERALGPDPVQSLAWSPDGHWLAWGSMKRVGVTELKSDGRLRVWTNQWSGLVSAVKYGADGRTLWVADGGPGSRAFIRKVNAESGKTERFWGAHTDTIYAIDLSADGSLLATAGGDTWVKIWETATGREVARLEGHTSAVLGVAFNTNGTQVVSGGADKQIKVWNIATREQIARLGGHAVAITAVDWASDGSRVLVATEVGGIFSYTDVKAHTGEQSSASGTEKRLADAGQPIHALTASSGERGLIVAGTESGAVMAWDREGKRRMTGRAGAVSAGVVGTGPANRVEVDRVSKSDPPLSFVRDVLPVLSKAGCNSGPCHAKPEGQNGLKLTVFSYDPKADHAEIVREARGRRVFPAAPEESLLLKKPLAKIAHEGGRRIEEGSEAHRMLAAWIRQGMPYEQPREPRLAGIEVSPPEGLYRKGSRVRLRVSARYSDGTTRDVTRLASYDSSEKEIVTVDGEGRMTVGQIPGEGVVIARYMGQVGDSKVAVPSPTRVSERELARLPVNNFVDELAYAEFRRLGLYPSGGITDGEFARRSSLDAIGKLPSAAEMKAFVADGDPRKRERWIARLLADPAYGDYWATKWADLLRPNPDRVGVKSVWVLDQWLREKFRTNAPYDQFVREIVAFEGTNHREGPAVIYRDRREPPELTTLFSQVFLGTRLECARCHHHPNEKWAQEDFYQFAAFFGSLKQKGAGLSPPISAGTETFYHAAGGEVKHPVTGAVMSPKAPDGPQLEIRAGTDPREGLADWMLAADNPFLAKAAVNRAWAVFFGRGFVEPVDDFRASNPCVHPKLLEALAADFVEHGYDWKHLFSTIMGSALYQQSSEPNARNLRDTKRFSRSYRRRLPAEVLLDAVSGITGIPEVLSGMAPGSDAVQAWSYKIDSQFLDAFGRPNSSSDCPCERDPKSSVVQSLHMMHAKGLQAKLGHADGRVRQLLARMEDPGDVVEELYWEVYGRAPTSAEREAASKPFKAPGANRQAAAEDVLWALLNSAEFAFNH